ncbi:hypothetical protein [Blastopirellula marina]|uniref:Uncharacterized protein n=1 Tax=Blastopirellula marina DSM 3645 TaxID=314230 RepID=A3ZRX3_9BACT|nr:hypothetical protein [Blastopirellula marina]EAQ80895.1 hypothetical protein DSM3645_12781 [Blastopirellula marina DSM 3645]
MRSASMLLTAVVLSCGCQSSYHFEGPTVENFDGQLLAAGKPVSFEPGQQVTLQLKFHGNGESFGVPIQPDGKFDIGWMPIGKYSGVLEYAPIGKDGNKRGGQPIRHSLPQTFEIVEGQTEYAVDLGKNWKP